MSTTKVESGTFHRRDEHRNIGVIESLLENVKMVAPKKYKAIWKKHKGVISRKTGNAIMHEGINALAEKAGVPAIQPIVESEDFKKILANRPKNATALVVAQKIEDRGTALPGDSYFKLVAVRTIALAWRERKRDSFKVLREIADTFEETKHLGTAGPAEVEHREHPQKRGSYLKQSDYYSNGWVVQSIPVNDPELREYKNMEDKLVEYTESKEEPKPQMKQELSVMDNIAKHSVEMTFTVRPPRSMVNHLIKKEWSSTKNRKLWYKLASPEAREFAESLKKKVNS